MQVTQHSQKLQLLAWAEELKTIAERRSDTATAKAIGAEIQDFASSRFMLAVIGKVKRGKSTFCNAFLGRRDDTPAPINKQPATSVISKFLRGERDACLVHFRDGRCETVDYRQIKDYVTEEANKENCKGVDCVEIVGPFDGLESDLTLVDTPGAGSLHQHHDALLHGFLPQADAVIFLVTADQPIAADELELLRQLKANDVKKVFFAINKVDDPHTDEEEIAQGMEHNRKMLGSVGIVVDKIHRISALKAMRGEVQDSGFPELFGDVSKFLVEHKLRILQAKFTGPISRLAAGLANSLAVEIESSAKSTEELDTEMGGLKCQREELTANRSVLERAFDRQWLGAVERFEHGVSAAEDVVRSKAVRKIAATGLLGVNALAQELPTYLNREIESELALVSSAFEQTAREAVDKLRLEYPQVTLGGVRGEVVVRTGKESATLLKGSIVGAGTAAAGYGIAAAASTTAASIAAANAAAIAAAHTTIAVAGPLAAAGSFIGSLPGMSALGSALGWLGTGTATVATTPLLAATPAWVALAGPIGWALAGVGALAIPFAYRISKLKLKDQLEESSRDHIKTVFHRLKSEQVPALGRMGTRIVGEFQARLENELSQIERALQAAQVRKRTNNTGTVEIEGMAAELGRLVQRGLAWK